MISLVRYSPASAIPPMEFAMPSSLQNVRFVQQAALVPSYVMKAEPSGHEVQIAQGLVALSLPMSLVAAAILHRRHQTQKRQRQIALLERLWQRSPNDKLR